MSYRLKKDVFGARAGTPVNKDQDGNFWIHTGFNSSIKISKDLPCFKEGSEDDWLTKEESEVYCLDRNEIVEKLAEAIESNPSYSIQGIIEVFLHIALGFRGKFTMPDPCGRPIDPEQLIK
jgi:hypothetical protein